MNTLLLPLGAFAIIFGVCQFFGVDYFSRANFRILLWKIKSRRRLFLWFGYRRRVAEDFQYYRLRINQWKKVHRTLGATPEECQEFNDLVLKAVGAWMLRCQAEKEPLFDETMERLLEELETWRD